MKFGYLFMVLVKGNFGVVWPFLFLFEGIRKVFEVVTLLDQKFVGPSVSYYEP